MIHEPQPNVVELRPKSDAPDKTVEVLMAAVEQLDQGVRLMTTVIGQQDKRIRALELAANKLKRTNTRNHIFVPDSR
jgi:alpha-D-ribose 1-methylphosphonate 5-triphosphate synthase subunit PhnH